MHGFGLIQAVQHYVQRGVGKTTSFNFLHFTMQEYFAALYISNLPEFLQCSQLHRTFYEGKYNFMWLMYVGIKGIRSSVLVSFLSVSQTAAINNKSELSFSKAILNDKRKCLYLFQCYMEAKNEKMPNVLSSIFTDGIIKLSGITLLPHHISSLIFFMSASITPAWKVLDLGNCNLRNIGINSLLEHFIKGVESASTLTYVDLTGNDTSPWGVYCAIIRHCCVDSLTLCGDDGVKDYVKEISENLKLTTTLQELTLQNIGRTGDQELNIPKDEISCEQAINDSHILLQGMYIVNNKIFNGISQKVRIKIVYDEVYPMLPQSIDLKSKGISDDAAAMLSFGLYNNTTVQKLDISCNKISA